ncbi:nuclear transport factor 2 family protein [Plantactinospora sp. GCM10030261]|uniref:nuclear transport factor 2 family protein n=1 Tax=Plantactinospora sp. GCM10030261 TaxID=3273420 RepID=UPI00360BF041
MRSTDEVARALYAAFLGGDADGMLALMHEDVHVRFLGQAELRGTDQVRAFMAFVGGLLTDVRFDLRHLIVDGDVAAGVWRETARTAAGLPWENHGVDVLHVRDGLIVGMHENNDVRQVRAHLPAYRPGTGTG